MPSRRLEFLLLAAMTFGSGTAIGQDYPSKMVRIFTTEAILRSPVALEKNAR